MHISMRCNGSHYKKERFTILLKAFQPIFQESVGFLRDNIGTVLPLVAGRMEMRLAFVALECGIEVLIGERVKQELGCCPASSMRGVVVVYSLGIEKLADIVGVVARFL